MNTAEDDEKNNLADIAKEVKHRVNGLLCIYIALITGTVIFCLAVFAVICYMAYTMFESGRMEHFRDLIIILLSLIIVVTTCVVGVLVPMLSLLENEKTGEEIRRNDYPELFAMIDEVVEKVKCLQPKHVYISNDCNACVSYPNIWANIFHGKMNLTIGLPLLIGLNKTEFKAVLAHEFGHVARQSEKIDRIANLSNLICTSISQSQNGSGSSEDDMYDTQVRFFAELATRIMNNQYLKLAPLNEILQKTREFEADMYPYQIVGTEATVSSWSKISYCCVLWNTAVGYLQQFMRYGERMPESVKMIVDIIVEDANRNYGFELTPSSHLKKSISENSSRIFWVNSDSYSHPTMADRCAVIVAKPVKNTIWDNTAALSFFSEEKVNQVFNSVVADLKSQMFANRTIFFKKDVTEEEVRNLVENSMPIYLDNFYSSQLFFCEDTSAADEKQQDTNDFPFTPENADVIEEYDIARRDLYLLQKMLDENLAQRSFYYNGILYTETNVPIREHREYLALLQAKAIEIVKYCNSWMSKNLE